MQWVMVFHPTCHRKRTIRAHCRRRRRRGTTAVLAMLYLVLFSSLAIGFYGAVTTASQVAYNERNAARAQRASESGMQFMRYQLATLEIPHNTSPSDLFSVVHTQLADRMNATGNLGTYTVGAVDGVIYIPVETGAYINADSNGSKFRAMIEQNGQQLRVRVIGQYSGLEVQRAIQLDYAIAQRASAIFDYGVASKSAIAMQGNTSITGAVDDAQGSVLSATSSTSTPITMSGHAEISGDVSIVNPSGGVSVGSSCSIAGTNNPTQWDDHVHIGVEEPEFPTIDTAAFVPYVTNTYTAAMGNTLTNCRIPANTNPSFAGGATITGVLYIETPNQVTFTGNASVQGVIVVQNDPTGTVSSNLIDFQGNVSATGVETLPASYGGLRSLTGAFLLAPNFSATFGGNFGTINGSIIASKMEFSGNAGGTVKGSVINLDDTSLLLAGNSDIIIESQGTGQYPAGVFFGSNYVPLPDTYQEVTP
jgi:hypothetical protein